MSLKLVFPVDSEGYTLAHTWLVSVRHPEVWLMRVASERHFAPRRNPYEMDPYETRQAVANVLCPPKSQDSTGVAVNYEQTKNGTGLCHAIFYSVEPVNFMWMRYFVYELHITATRGSARSLIKFLERGGKGSDVILPPLLQGLPIRDNLALCKKESARRMVAEAERQRKDMERRQMSLYSGDSGG